MCGIVGYIGPRDAAPILLDGPGAPGVPRLRLCGHRPGHGGRRPVRGEARGQAGEPADRAARHDARRLRSAWRTPAGRPTAGPTTSTPTPTSTAPATITVIHNGIIENFAELRDGLVARGHRFDSETDTEVIAHLVEEAYAGDIADAVRAALRRARGAYAVAVLHVREPDRLVGRTAERAAHRRPGRWRDLPRLRRRCRPGTYPPGHLPGGWRRRRPVAPTAAHHRPRRRSRGRPAGRSTSTGRSNRPRRVATSTSCSRRCTSSRPPSGRRHRRAPRRRRDADRGAGAGHGRPRGGRAHRARRLRQRRLRLRGRQRRAPGLGGHCRPAGTSARSSATARRRSMLARSSSRSPSRARRPTPSRRCAWPASAGCPVIAVTNTVGSAITREADAVLFLQAGPEIAVVATKTFVTQVTTLVLLAAAIAKAGVDACERGSGSWSPPSARCPTRRSGRWSWPLPRRSWRAATSTRAASCSWGGAWATRWPSRARSSSRR